MVNRVAAITKKIAVASSVVVVVVVVSDRESTLILRYQNEGKDTSTLFKSTVALCPSLLVPGDYMGLYSNSRIF